MVGEIFSVQAYHHLLTVVSSMITHKLNPRVYNSLLVLLNAVRLKHLYRLLDTLPIYLYYELLIKVTQTVSTVWNRIKFHVICCNDLLVLHSQTTCYASSFVFVFCRHIK